MLGFITDIGQDEEIERLKSRLRKLEIKISRGNDGMSNIIKDLVGQDCVITFSDGFPSEKCRIVDVDDEWLKVIIYGKKKDATKIIRIETIDNIEL